MQNKNSMLGAIEWKRRKLMQRLQEWASGDPHLCTEVKVSTCWCSVKSSEQFLLLSGSHAPVPPQVQMGSALLAIMLGSSHSSEAYHLQRPLLSSVSLNQEKVMDQDWGCSSPKSGWFPQIPSRQPTSEMATYHLRLGLISAYFTASEHQRCLVPPGLHM